MASISWYDSDSYSWYDSDSWDDSPPRWIGSPIPCWWDDSPTPMAGATQAEADTPCVTPVGGVELATPTPGAMNSQCAITPAMFPLLKTVCQSKESWQVRYTGIGFVQQSAILMGREVVPHLWSLVEIIEQGLVDENERVRTITALSLAALAEASAPCGIKSFESVVKPLLRGIRSHCGEDLAAFLKAIGFIIPLMEAKHASYYTKQVMVLLIRESELPEEEVRRTVLKVVKQCVSTEGVQADYVRSDILPDFFRYFWVRGMAIETSIYKQLVETTVEIAKKVGVADIVGRIVEGLKDELEPYRIMAMETIEKVVDDLGCTDIDACLEKLLIDGILYAFQEQNSYVDNVMLNGFGAVVNSLGRRVKPYLPQICDTIKWCLYYESSKVRQQAADLISRIAVVMKQCEEENLMGDLVVVLYNCLVEDSPEVLGSVLKALKAILNVTDMTRMTHPFKICLLRQLAPFLKNRHKEVGFSFPLQYDTSFQDNEESNVNEKTYIAQITSAMLRLD